MARPWLRLDAGMVEHPRIAELREGLKASDADAACWAFVVLLMGAKRSGGGEFRSDAHLKAVMGPSYKWVGRLRAVGFLEELTVRDWDQYQVDVTSSERSRKWRERRANVREQFGDGEITTDSTQTVHRHDKTNNPLPPSRVSGQKGGAPVRLGDLLKKAIEVSK